MKKPHKHFIFTLRKSITIPENQDPKGQETEELIQDFLSRVAYTDTGLFDTVGVIADLKEVSCPKRKQEKLQRPRL